MDSETGKVRWLAKGNLGSGSFSLTHAGYITALYSFDKVYGFPISHARMWELDHKGGWPPKNWYFQIMMLEKTLESPLDCKEIKSVNLKGNQSWIFPGGTDAEAEVSILWPPDVKSRLIGEDSDAGKDWRQENEMVGWHHWLNGHGFGKTPGDSEGQRSFMCCSPWGGKGLDTIDWLTEQQQDNINNKE